MDQRPKLAHYRRGLRKWANVTTPIVSPKLGGLLVIRGKYLITSGLLPARAGAPEHAWQGELQEFIEPLLFCRHQLGSALGTPICCQNLFAKPQSLGRNFHEFVVGDEFNRLLQIERLMRNQPNGFIGG